MTLDEAIVHARQVAERNRNQYKNCPSDRTDIRHQTCEECAKEHDQLAEWLEELKQYRAIGTVEECKNSVLKILEAYNKAVDDFETKLIAHLSDWKLSEAPFNDDETDRTREIICETIENAIGAVDEITEQLKGGDGE